MAGPAIHLTVSAAPARSTRHDCPLCERINLPGFKAVCTPCRKTLPQHLWQALDKARARGRGAETAEWLAALKAAESHLESKGES